MLKKYLLICLLGLGALNVQAQTIKGLAVGKKITKVAKVEMSISTEAMGQTMEQSISSTTTTESTVADVKPTAITINQVVSKMKMSMSVMGQSMEFDSEHPDADENLKPLGEGINKTSVITADQNGIITNLKLDTAVTNMANMPAMGKLSKDEPLDFLLALPENATVGQTWNKSYGTDSSKNNFKYTIRSINNGIATVDIEGTSVSNTTIEQAGMSIESKLSGTVTGSAEVEVSTNLIKTRKTKTSLKGTNKVMGMDLPTETVTSTEETIQ